MNAINLEILLPAFLAGAIVLITHVPLGTRVLARGAIFVDLAIAQIVGLGMIIAQLLGLHDNILAVQALAAVFALLGAALLSYTEHTRPKTQEANIGITFVLAATLGMLLLNRDPHGGEYFKDLLAGQILWVSTTQLIAAGVLTAILSTLWLLFHGRFGRFAFYGQFALAVTASVQLVGVYLVFASLIIPALATRNYPRRQAFIAYGVGLAGYALGLVLSGWQDWPAGPAIVWAMALCGAAAWGWKRV